MSIARSLALSIISVACSQCASGPSPVRKVEVKQGSRALVKLEQAAVNLTLINQSALTEQQANQARKADPSLKLLPDEQMQVLLDMLGGHEFFDRAADVGDPEARSWLTVIVDGKQHVLSGRASRGDHASMVRFNECLNLFNVVYSARDEFTGSKMTTGELKRAGQSTNSETAAIKSKKENSKRP